MVTVQEQDFDAAALIAALRERSAGAAGALVTFIGYVRDYAPQSPTHTLFLEHYPGMCERELTELCQTAKQRWDILDCLIVHRVGRLEHKEQIVFVGVTSAHRGQAYRASEYIIDTLKTRAPFWKRETLASGDTFWVQQNEADARKTASWQEAGTHTTSQEHLVHENNER